MKEEPKRKEPQNAKVDINLDKLDKIKSLAILLYEKFSLTMQDHDGSIAEGLAALTDVVWWICKSIDETIPQNENEPRTFDLFIEALKLVDDERFHCKKTSKENREGNQG